MYFRKKITLFCFGGGLYGALELLWRGRTHWSMLVTGGLCFVMIGQLGKVTPPLSLLPRTLAGAGIITMLELCCGMIVNRSYTIWDYRQMPMNFHGQICLPFTLLWIPVSFFAILLYDKLDKTLTFAPKEVE